MSDTYDPDREDEKKGTRGYNVTGNLNMRGRDYRQGDVVELTEEEYESLKAVGANVEGVEQKTPEEIQSAHDEGIEAQKAAIDERAEKEKEKDTKEEERRREDVAKEAGEGNEPEYSTSPEEEGQLQQTRKSQSVPNPSLHPPVPTPPKPKSRPQM